MNKPIIWAVVGPSGSGKDTVAAIVRSNPEWNVLCSYTTRKMRSGETDGLEHVFIDGQTCREILSKGVNNRIERTALHKQATFEDVKDEVMAYTEYGGYEYMTLCSQVDATRRNLYVIDERGLNDLFRDYSDIFCICTLLMKCSVDTRKQRGIALERMFRDSEREPLKHTPQLYIQNDGSLFDLQNAVNHFIQRCAEYEDGKEVRNSTRML